MNLLILGDRKPLNDSDDAFATLIEAGHRVTFLHGGATSSLPFAMLADEGSLIEHIRSTVRERKIDVIYFRVDWFDKLYARHAATIFAADFGVPIVFGYHCHTCHRTPLEALSLARADALVLINEESRAWFADAYGISKPTMLVPSLFLPRRSFYEVPLRSKRSASDGVPHVVIPSNVIRTANVPAKLDPNVPIENYVLDRYDYLRLCEQLLRRGVAVSVYGKFSVQGNTDASAAEAAYRKLAEGFAGRLHFPGRVDQRDFATELSQYDAALLTGFVPYQPVPRFDHMNYQLRLNPVLAARLPSFVPAGTASCMEREIADTRAGFIFESIDEVADRLHDDAAMQRASNAAHAAQDRHSFEHWSPGMADFFGQVVRSHQNRSSARAA
jgi:hypothetical protein